MNINWYNALGDNKTQRFWRFMAILMLLSGVICYGFYSKAVTFKEVKVIESKNQTSKK